VDDLKAIMNKYWQENLNEYTKQGEPQQYLRALYWKTAIGLQDVDGLKPSQYLLETARENIEGKLSIDEVQQKIASYYEERGLIAGEKGNEDSKEADLVASRITKLLSENTFQFSPAELLNIHRRLFTGIFSHAGELRKYNIEKKEWVLGDKTVIYAAWDSIWDTLKYDFDTEKNFQYDGLSSQKAIEHIAEFTAGIWQIHPFAEGNTRTTAVFIVKYLRAFGFDVGNDVFADNSWYFRNALVRANYNDLPNNIYKTLDYLVLFFENLLAGGTNELRNRYLSVDFQSATEKPKCKTCTLNVTLVELAVLNAIAQKPNITQKELAGIVGKSERSVKSITVNLQSKGYLLRENGKRYGSWKVLK